MLTRRGRILVAGLLVAMAMARLFGARSLNALVAPALVALLAAFVQVRWLDLPSLHRDAPSHGFVDEELAVRMSFDADSPFEADIVDEVGDGLTARGNRVTTTVGTTAIEYQITLDERGQRSIGPAQVNARDVLGLFERELECSVTETLLAFPRIHPLRGSARKELASLQRAVEFGNQEFDHLREYVRGDPLRDIHWKTTAKRAGDDLIVKEMDVPEGNPRVTIAAEADAGSADAMAEATASIAVYLLDAGLSVGLVTPRGTVEPDDSDGHRTELLTILALADAGSVSVGRKPEADIVVRGTGGDVLVTVAEQTRPFAAFAGIDDHAHDTSPSAARADGGRTWEAGR